mmetsp:Transcript_12337/g.19441  ORF Transcript_12337/g.19441 Transcript_12337/m.19441 type:complete len:337 (+) Transcript_12337:469-1479(+)
MNQNEHPDGMAPKDPQRTLHFSTLTLCNMAEFPHTRMFLADKGAIPPLVRVMTEAAVLETQTAAMQAVAYLMEINSLAEIITDAGAVESLCAMLWTASASKAAAHGIAALALNSERAAQMAWKTGADGIIELLQWRDPEGVHMGMEAVSAMARWDSVNRVMLATEFEEAPFMDIVTRIFLDGETENYIADETARALVNMWRRSQALEFLIKTASDAEFNKPIFMPWQGDFNRSNVLGPVRILTAIDALVDLILSSSEARTAIGLAMGVPKYQADSVLKDYEAHIGINARLSLLFRKWIQTIRRLKQERAANPGQESQLDASSEDSTADPPGVEGES